jgi:hypothetical protein
MLLTSLNSTSIVEVEIEVKLRPTISRPVRLGVRHPSGTRDQFLFLLEIFFRQLRVYFVVPSLTRGRDCNLLLILVFARAVPLGCESRATLDHIILSQFLRFPQPGAPDPRIYIPRNRVAQLHPLALGSPPLRTRRATVEVFYPASTRESRYCYQVKVTLRPTASQSVLVSNPIWDFGRRASFSSKLRYCFSGEPSLTRGRVCHLSVLVNIVYSSQSGIT